MINYVYKYRPTCAQLLTDVHKWKLTTNEVNHYLKEFVPEHIHKPGKNDLLIRIIQDKLEYYL